MTEKNKPTIRFKGFADAWEQRKLGDIAEIVSGGTPDTNNPDYWDGDINWYAPAEISDQIYVIESERKITEMGLKKSSAKMLPAEKTILFTSRAGIGKVAILRHSACTNQGFQSLVLKDGYEPYFVYSMGNQLKEKAEAIASGSTFLEISGKMLANLDIMIPNREEQIKIASYFQGLDNLITLHQRKCYKLVNIKKSMLEKMFPQNGSSYPEVRFEGFTDAWEQRKLVDEVELFGGLTYSPNNIVKENGTLVLRSSNVKNGEVVNADNVYVDSSVVNSSNVKEGDIIVVVRNGSRSLIGKHAQIKAEMSNTVIGAFMTGIRSDHSAFVNALLNTQGFDSEVEKNLGATINQITNAMFQQMEFMFPKAEEQNRIGEMFTHLDNLITLHQRELDKLKNIKKACLEKMFI